MADPLCRWRYATPRTIASLVSILPKQVVPKDEFWQYVRQHTATGTPFSYETFAKTAYQLAVQVGLYYIDDTDLYHPRFLHNIDEDEARRYLSVVAKNYISPNPYAPSMAGASSTVNIYNQLIVEATKTPSHTLDVKSALQGMYNIPIGNADAITALMENAPEFSKSGSTELKFSPVNGKLTAKEFFDLFTWGSSRTILRLNSSVIDVALKLFAEKRSTLPADVWPSFDDWVKDARQTFASIDEHQIVAPTFDYNHFVKFVFSSRQRTTFSKFDDSQKAIVGKFLREERTSPHTASWYLDPANKVPVEGIGIGIMFYFMMMVRPDEFATWSGMMDEGLFILGLRSDPKSDEPTVANYEKTKALQQIIMQKMHEMGIGKAADDNSPADYLTVNEFLWFVTANEKDIKEELMKKQLKKPTGETAPGTKKLSDVLSSKADDLMNRLVAALLTKPFAILAGASGTGKSRMAKKLAYMTCLDKDLQPSEDSNGKRKPLENFIIVPVKPNWHDSSDLLGYRSSIKEKGYQTTPFINFIIKAHCFPNTPFIACLDEMNLAPVEHYFAEYLSASEGSIEDAESGKSVSYPLIEPALFDADVTNLQLDGYTLPAETKELIERVGLVIPKNLFVVGTVNMDDSTDQISRKVLDRAMTIEMNDVNYSNLQNDNYEKLDISSLLLVEDDIAKFSKREAYDPAKLDNDFRVMLDNIKAVFEETPFALGYRFGIESTLYREALKKLPLKDETGADVEYNKIAVDHMTLMKVLPRITGTVDERSELLSRLKVYFKDTLDDKGLSKTALARMEKAAKSNGGYLGFWP